jgi:predicted RNase H-like HicB family nuclease
MDDDTPASRRRQGAAVTGIAPYNIYFEVAPGEACAAHVAELPGCHVLAIDESDALARLPEAIDRHRAWRERHGLPRVGEEGAPLIVRQSVFGARPWRVTGASALFSIDRRLLTDQEVDAHLRLLACARADLLRAAHTIPRGAFDDVIPGDQRTPREVLIHTADTEEWLVSRLGRRVTVLEPDPLRRLVDVRACTLEHLMRYDRADRDLIFVPTERTSEDPDEMWSLRKFLRRLIEHELDHLEDLQIAASHWSHGTGLD